MLYSEESNTVRIECTQCRRQENTEAFSSKEKKLCQEPITVGESNRNVNAEVSQDLELPSKGVITIIKGTTSNVGKT